ncbi:MAG: PucR family transcriptional regulator [Nocardioides sp.]
MSEIDRDGSTPSASRVLTLDPELTGLLAERLREVAGDTVAAIMGEVPAYAGALSGRMGENIEDAVAMALAGFLRLATRGPAEDPATPLAPALEGAYELGRGEARNGRSVDALLAAYRVGARVSWRELSATAVAAGVPAPVLADFAELVFAYIDALSASSVAGHTDELASSDRVRERALARLAAGLLRAEPADVLKAASERAGWAVPRTLTAVILPEAQVRPALGALDPRTLQATEEWGDLTENLAVLLVPDAHGVGRRSLLRTLAGRSAVVGPDRPWQEVSGSYRRALRALRLSGHLSGHPPGDSRPVDTEEHLVELVLHADPEALSDLRAQVLAPLAGLKEATRDKLVETLRAWLSHHGRRDDVAAALYVHPQTVRYRMGQVRDRYGDALDDPRTLVRFTVALGLPPGLPRNPE